MIEVEIEDEAWTQALPTAEAVVIQAATAALHSSSSPPAGEEGARAPQEHGKERGRWEVSVRGGATPLSPIASDGSLPLPQGERGVSILLTDDATVQDLNARFRGKDAATNVLSFPAPQTARPHLGDVALAYGVCAREAQGQGKTLAAHLAHLTAHGVLHLIGYDHDTEAEAEAMEGLERAILASLGLPDPYENDVQP
jgi:probable rRNA maturation factor